MFANGLSSPKNASKPNGNMLGHLAETATAPPKKDIQVPSASKICPREPSQGHDCAVLGDNTEVLHAADWQEDFELRKGMECNRVIHISKRPRGNIHHGTGGYEQKANTVGTATILNKAFVIEQECIGIIIAVYRQHKKKLQNSSGWAFSQDPCQLFSPKSICDSQLIIELHP